MRALLGLALLAVILGGCIATNVEQCANGLICPAGLVCVGNSCAPPGCGDGVKADDEVCDDGNVLDGDGCARDCLSDEVCGNGVTDPVQGEQCDDGNRLSHDGCTDCREETPDWADIAPKPLPPAIGSTMAYDTRRHRLVLVNTDETWERGACPEAPAPRSVCPWIRATPATQPPTRAGQGIAFDAARGRTVIFGGRFGGSFTSQTWEWDGGTWVQRELELEPPARNVTAMAYDAAREQIVLFGGRGTQTYGDTWLWDGSSWTKVSPATSPPPRSSHAMAYDAKRQRVVLTAGLDASQQALSDTWEWDGTSWVERMPATVFEPRSSHAMAYDPVESKIILYGGQKSAGNEFLGDTWEWDGNDWQGRMPDGDTPGIRGAHSMAFDAGEGRTVLVGGRRSQAGLDDVWEWDGNEWTNATWLLQVPPPRQGEASAYDAKRGRMLLFGGFEIGPGATPRDDMWQWDGVQWLEIAPNDPWPSARSFHAMAYDERRDRLVLYGGNDGADQDETWEWDGEGWELVDANSAPGQRTEHAMTYDRARGRVLLSAGETGGAPEQDLWEWDGQTWQYLSTYGAKGRSSHTLTYDGRRGVAVVNGGNGGELLYADIVEWDGTDWVGVTPDNTSEHTQHASCYLPELGKHVTFGGADGFTCTEGTSLWDGESRTIVTTSADDPGPRCQATLSYDHRRRGGLLYSSSFVGDNPLSTLWLFRFGLGPASSLGELCEFAIDADGDGFSGCDDPDCWALCTPSCPPGDPACDPEAPRCGDGVCNEHLETDLMCPQDCPRPQLCGDFVCDAGESCPGDCD